MMLLFRRGLFSLLLLADIPTSSFGFDGPAVPRGDFFHHLTGVQETDFVEQQAALLPRVFHDGCVHNLETGVSWPAGTFQTYSIYELEQLLPARPIPEKSGSFNVILGYNTRGLSLAKKAELDIQALQADPTNKGALFQIASNFDCLENASTLNQGHHWLSQYIYDMMQGPFGAISAAPGLFLRAYGQGEEEINLLSNFPQLPLRRGYLVLAEASRATVRTAAGLDHKDIQVGVHRDVGVVFGQQLPRNQHRICPHAEQAISQLYVSSLDLGTASGNNLAKKFKSNPRYQADAQAIAKSFCLPLMSEQ